MKKTKKQTKVFVTIGMILTITVISLAAIFVTRFIVQNNLTANAAQYNVANTSTTEDGRFEYTELRDGTIEITKYVGTDKALTIPGTIDGKNVTSIGISAFSFNNNLISATIPEGVTNIGNSAFKSCFFMKSIILPDSITNIGKEAFMSCVCLTQITIPEKVTSISDGVFDLCNNLAEVKIPEGVRSIGKNAFNTCDKLTNITIPENVTSIGESAFSRCKSLTNITIPEGVTKIENSTFSSCSSLTEIIIPEKVTSIGISAFKSCSNLTEITIPKGVSSIGNYAFENCSNLTEINVDSNNSKYSSENGVLFNKEKTSLNCYPAGKKDTTYIIPESVKCISDSAFTQCNNLTKIKMPNGLKTIEKRAFLGCKGLTEIIIPEGITSIEYMTFTGCTELKKVELPKGLKGIGESVFHGCSSLEKIILPKGLASIGVGAFRKCTSLTEIVIPEEVITIEIYAFTDCSNLTIYCKSNSVAEEYAKQHNIKYLIYSENPIVTSVTGNPTEWTKENVTLTINVVSDRLSELEENPYSFDGGVTWQKENTKTYEKNTEGIIIQVRNKLGNTYIHKTINITNIDSTLPIAGTLTMKLENGTGNDYENNTLTNENVYIELSNGSDEHSGHKTTIYSINGGEAMTEPQILTNDGTYEIIVTTEDNAGNISTNSYIIKIGNIKCSSQEYKIENEYISKIQPETTVETFKSNLQTNATEINVYNNNGEVQEDTAVLKTGMQVELRLGEKTQVFTIAVSGDINGDGEVKLMDLLEVNRSYLKIKNLEGAKFLAADINQNGKIEFIDVLLVNRLKLKQSI